MTIKIGLCNLKFTLIPSLAYVLLMVLLISLGNWQLSRSSEKAAYLAEQEKQSQLPPLSLTSELPADAATIRYRVVELTGRYDADRQFLLDNQIRHGKAGYFVMTPLLPVNSNTAVLVNRGWIEAGRDRQTLPDITLQKSKVTVQGRINTFPDVGYHLEGAEIPTDTWPSLVQLIDSNVIAEKLGYPLANYQIELHQAEDEGYLREWHIATVIPPEKHVAYAVQWYGLALTLTALFLWYACKTKHE